MPLLLFGYVAYLLMLGQVTGQGAVNGYAWLFTGLCIAAANEQLASRAGQGAAPAPPPTSSRPASRRSPLTAR